jgi:hypothetical protein
MMEKKEEFILCGGLDIDFFGHCQATGSTILFLG